MKTPMLGATGALHPSIAISMCHDASQSCPGVSRNCQKVDLGTLIHRNREVVKLLEAVLFKLPPWLIQNMEEEL